MRHSKNPAQYYYSDNRNPMESDDEKYESPLKKYEHLLPSSNHRISSQDQYFFLVNISVLFPLEDAENLRLAVARTSDRGISPYTGESDVRKLFYAALVAVQTPPEETSDKVKQQRPTRTLLRGPAVPHFTAPPPETKAGSNKSSGYYSMSSTPHERHIDEDKELQYSKEKAIALFISKVEELVHAEISGDGSVEVWDSKVWKFSEEKGTEAKEAKEVREMKSTKEGTLKVGETQGGRRSSWFSKV